MRFFILLSVLLVANAEVCFIGADPTTGLLNQQVCLNDDNDNVVSTTMIVGGESALWMLVAAVHVFFMQTGFSMIEAGSIRAKNVENTLFKNFMDVAVVGIVYYIFGYAFAFGSADDAGNKFIGDAGFALNDNTNYMNWFAEFTVAAIAITIVGGALAGRISTKAYLCYTMVFAFFIYPVITHWTRSANSWLVNDINNDGNGVLDAAGSGYIHMVGGFAGLMGAWMLGPRAGGAHNDKNSTLVALGTFILWFGFYGLTTGPASNALAGKVATVTTLSAASSALLVTVVNYFFTKKFDLNMVTKAILCGLVAISAGCQTISPGLSIAVGVLAGLFYYLGKTYLMPRLTSIDDPLDIFLVHGLSGAWGVLAAGIFSTRDNIFAATGVDNDHLRDGKQFGYQLTGVVVIAAWMMITTFIAFFVMKRTIGIRDDDGSTVKGEVVVVDEESDSGDDAKKPEDVEMEAEA